MFHEQSSRNFIADYQSAVKVRHRLVFAERL